MQKLQPQWYLKPPVPIDERTVGKAQDQIASCETCALEEAEIPFDYVLDCITGRDPQCTDYVLNVLARFPRCESVVQTGQWNWFTGPDGKRTAWIVPGTLVTMMDK